MFSGTGPRGAVRSVHGSARLDPSAPFVVELTMLRTFIQVAGVAFTIEATPRSCGGEGERRGHRRGRVLGFRRRALPPQS